MNTVINNYRSLVRNCMRYGATKETAEDVVQSLALQEIEQGSYSLGYYIVASKNKTCRANKIISRDLHNFDRDAQAEDTRDTERQILRLHQALATLPPQQYAAVLDQYTGKNEHTRKNNKKIGMAKLRAKRDEI